MKSVKEMSPEDLAAEIRDRKIKAFDQAVMMQEWGSSMLALSGFKHWSDPIKFADRMNKARMADFEKEHRS